MVPFSTANKTANKAIQDFVCRNTKGLINNNFNFDINTLFVLINTLYLKDTWNSLGKELFFTNEEYEFQNKDNSVKSLKLLNGYLVAVMDLPPFLASLCTCMINRGLGSLLSGGFGVSWPSALEPAGWFRSMFRINSNGTVNSYQSRT